MAKTELRRGADAAARYGARYITKGQSVAFARAAQAANENNVDGTPLVLQSADVTVGNWNTTNRTFTVNGTPRNAIRVIAQRTAARGNATSLKMGPLVGMATCDIKATSIAMTYPASFVGLNGVSFKNNAFVASYDSSVTTNPTMATASSNAYVQTNGYLGDQNNGQIKGTVVLGPSGTMDPSMAVTNGNVKASTAVPALPEPAWSPSGNPGGIPQNYTVSSPTTLAGGTYWFTSLNVTSELRFSGAATVYVNGNITYSGDAFSAYNLIPGNLRIYQIGAGRTFSVTSSNIGALVASIKAPRSDFSSENNLKFYGDMLFNTISVKNNAEMYYDESAASVLNIYTVK